MEINKDDVGFRISNIRKRLGLNQELFGKKINQAHKSLVSKWEKGQSLPNNERLKLIAELGGISVDELLYGSFENRVIQLISNYINENENAPYSVLLLEKDNQLNVVLHNVLNFILSTQFHKNLDNDKLMNIIDEQITKEFIRGEYSNENAISYIRDYIAINVSQELYEYFYRIEEGGKMKLRDNMSQDLYDLLNRKVESFLDDLKDTEYEIFGDI